MTTAETTDRKANPFAALLAWSVGLLMFAVLALNIASAMGWYTPPAWRAQTPVEQPTAPIPTQEPPRPLAPVVAAPVAPQPVIVQQQPGQAPPQVVIPPAAPVAPRPADRPTAQPPQVVYIQSTGGSTVATGAGTNRADGGASTGVCALGKGARRCGR